MAMSAALDVMRRLDEGRGRVRTGRSGGLRRLLGADEGIVMLERRHGYFPRAFAWRGRLYEVRAVERCWTVSRPGIQGRVERYVFRVRARPRSGDLRDETALDIYQDARRNAWYVRR